MKTYILHCGNYRHFEVDANSKEHAIKRFDKAAKNTIVTSPINNTHGFNSKDVTLIEEKKP